MYFENNLLITAQDMQNCFMSKIISCFSAVFDVKRFSKIIREEHFVTLSYNIHVPNQCMNPMWCDYFISYFVNDECFFCNQILSSFESVFYQKKGWVIYFYDFSVPWGSFFQTHYLNHQHLFFSFVQTETWEQPDIFCNTKEKQSELQTCQIESCKAGDPIFMYTCSWKHSRPYLTLSFAYFCTKWLHNSLLNHLTPRSNEHVTSPYNIYTMFNKQVTRMLKLIKQKLLLD